ncbi:hypothetical protein K435DRAFT_965717 [Dendrothele bispora CBS 962.96]|uniref:DUF6570 domain-containing protein n=1 Tax=Dendrothele bispora (strain CBS 962.96) TaxID=1314807 RepID=A0A4S8M4Q5_DENBC|nr:hypothetical protein K435DRAFT_965717 [Dendrothele bispora CBS 962.96]
MLPFLTRGKVPPLSLANYMFLGDVPPELRDLTVVEEALKEEERASDPNTQRGVKGYIIIYPQQQQLKAVARLLPPSIEEISSPICILLIGSQPPSLRRALQWLKLYKDVEINNRVLVNLPDNYVLHIEHIPTNESLETLTSRYDSISVPDQPSDSVPAANTDIPFESVVVADVDGNASANELRAAAAMSRVKNDGAYVQVAHDPVPANEFYNTGGRCLGAAGALGLVLHYLESAMRKIELQEIFALVPSVLSRYLDFSLDILPS